MAVAAVPTSVAVDRFRGAEQAVFAKHGVAVRERWVDLAPSGARVRVIESGAGTPVILLPGLGAVAAG